MVKQIRLDKRLRRVFIFNAQSFIWGVSWVHDWRVTLWTCENLLHVFWSYVFLRAMLSHSWYWSSHWNKRGQREWLGERVWLGLYNMFPIYLQTDRVKRTRQSIYLSKESDISFRSPDTKLKGHWNFKPQLAGVMLISCFQGVFKRPSV